jgi:hypothetical protein
MGTADIVLDEWQENMLKVEGNIVLCTGRQVGKTTIMAMKAVEYMINNPGSKIIIVSLTEDQAKLIIIMMLDYMEKKDRRMIARGKNKPTQNKLILTNKSSALARPVGTTGDAVRGFTGDVLIIDEASRMPELVWTASRPTLLTTGGQIWMCSTPHGKQGYFWEAFQNKNDKYFVFHISSEKAIHDRPVNDNWTETKREGAINFLELEKSDMSSLQYGQEYLGLFLDELRQYFPDELIEKVCSIKRRETILKNRYYSLGVDIARMGNDSSTFEIIDKISEKNLVQVENIVTKKTRTTQTEDRIFQLNRQYDNIKNIYIDAGSGSLGVGVFDHLLDNPETKRKVVAINNRARPLDREGKKKTKLLKEDLYDNLLSLMERGYIKLLDDEDIRISLKSVQYEFLKKEMGFTQMRIFGNDTHIAEGLIRAAWCVKDKRLNIWVY